MKMLLTSILIWNIVICFPLTISKQKSKGLNLHKTLSTSKDENTPEYEYKEEDSEKDDSHDDQKSENMDDHLQVEESNLLTTTIKRPVKLNWKLFGGSKLNLKDPKVLLNWMKEKTIKLSAAVSPRKSSVNNFIDNHMSLIRQISRKVISSYQVDLDVSYGKDFAEKLDIIYGDYSIKVSAAIVFLFGIDVSDNCRVSQAEYSFFALAFAKVGITVFIANYPVKVLNDPSILNKSMDQLMNFVIQECKAMEIKNIYLAGYSSGANIVALFLSKSTHLPNISSLIKDVFFISGVFNWLFLNSSEEVNLIKKSIEYENIIKNAEVHGYPTIPIQHTKIATIKINFPSTRIFFFVGEFDPDDYKNQAYDFITVLKNESISAFLFNISWADHFYILEQMKDSFSTQVLEIISVIKMSSAKIPHSNHQASLNHAKNRSFCRKMNSEVFLINLAVFLSLCLTKMSLLLNMNICTM